MADEGLLYKKMLHTVEEVDAKIDEMAAEIIRKYDPHSTLFVGLLNGALPFQTKLMFAIARQDPSFHPNAQFMIVSRYADERDPGMPSLVADLPKKYHDLADQTVVLIDDLIDEGDTLEFAAEHLLEYGAKEVHSVVLVKKEKDTTADRQTMYNSITYGFEAPDVWLTGMGMDDSRLTRGSGRLGDEGNRWAGWIAEANTR